VAGYRAECSNRYQTISPVALWSSRTPVLERLDRPISKTKKETAVRHEKPCSSTQLIMSEKIEHLDRIVASFDPNLRESTDAGHLSFSSLPTEVLLMAQELLKVKLQLKDVAQIVGRELARIDDQVCILDQESQKIKESFASTVGERLGETDNRPARH